MRRQDAKPRNIEEIFARRKSEAQQRAQERRKPGALLTPAALRIRNHAKSVLFEAIFRKQLIRPAACCECGNADRRIQAHQTDFTKPLDVIWLCGPCNKPRRSERIAAYKAAMAAGGGTVAGLWIAGYNVRRDASPPPKVIKTLQAYSRKRGARGGDAATQRAARVYVPKPDPNANDAVQKFIETDLERYLCGLPSCIAEVLAGKGAEVVMKGVPERRPAAPIPLPVSREMVPLVGNYGDIVTFGSREEPARDQRTGGIISPDQEYQLTPDENAVDAKVS